MLKLLTILLVILEDLEILISNLPWEFYSSAV